MGFKNADGRFLFSRVDAFAQSSKPPLLQLFLEMVSMCTVEPTCAHRAQYCAADGSARRDHRGR